MPVYAFDQKQGKMVRICCHENDIERYSNDERREGPDEAKETCRSKGSRQVSDVFMIKLCFDSPHP